MIFVVSGGVVWGWGLGAGCGAGAARSAGAGSSGSCAAGASAWVVLALRLVVVRSGCARKASKSSVPSSLASARSSSCTRASRSCASGMGAPRGRGDGLYEVSVVGRVVMAAKNAR